MTFSPLDRVYKPRFVPKARRCASKHVGARDVLENRELQTLSEQTKLLSSDSKVPIQSQATQESTLPQWRLEAEYEQQKTKEVALSWVDKAPGDMSDRDWKVMMRELGLEMSSNVRPLKSWDQLPQKIAERALRARYLHPTPVQAAVVPLAMTGCDLVAVAQTGSGKTAAFVLPLCQLKPKRSIQALVLAPTRELAQQTLAEFSKLAGPLGLLGACVVGGHDILDQADALDTADVVVATPGRLVDCLEQGLVQLGACACLVLDEADRMVDMGFEDQLTVIIKALPAHQTLMFSATWPPGVERLSQRFLRQWEQVKVRPRNRTIEQNFELVETPQRAARVAKLVARGPAIVFVNHKLSADQLTDQLRTYGVKASAMHGDKSQEQREAALHDLKAGRVLVATDVAGRGIDVPDVRIVVNYELPRTVEAYIHRIGRTGRAGKTGLAVSLVSESDRPLFSALAKITKVPDFMQDKLGISIDPPRAR